MRYIDADKLPRHGKRGGLVYWRDIEAQPTADVVEVISYIDYIISRIQTHRNSDMRGDNDD